MPCHRTAKHVQDLFAPWFAAALACVPLTSAAASPMGPLEPLELHYGSNEIPAALPDGRPVTILMTRRENGNAHGYDLYVVYALDKKGVPRTAGTPEIIDLQPSSGLATDTIRNDPFDGEAEIESLRFVRTRVDGHPVLALVKARRQVEQVKRLTDPAQVELTTWRLDGPVAAAGRTTYVFVPTKEVVTERRYCDATSALHTELGIDFPDGWDASPSIDGCDHGAAGARGAIDGTAADPVSARMLRTLEATTFPDATGPRRRGDLRTFPQYGLTRIESFADGWSCASAADESWTVGLRVLEDGPRRKLLCVTDAATGGTYRSTAVVEAVNTGGTLWHATGRHVTRADCAAR